MLRIGLNSLKKEDSPNPKTHEKVYSFFAFFSSSTAFGRGKLLLMNFSNYNGKPPLKLRSPFFLLLCMYCFHLRIPQESVQHAFLGGKRFVC